MEKEPQQPISVFAHFDTFNLICSFLTLKEKLVMSSVSKLSSFFLEEHFSHHLSQGIYDKSSDKTMRQLIKYNFNRNLKIVKIPSLFTGGKQESTYYNFFKNKCITRVEAEGKHFVAFIDNKHQAYIARVSEFLSVKFQPNIQYEIIKDVKRVFCKAERLFALNIDGTVTIASLPDNNEKVFDNLQLIEWTLRVPVISMTVSKNYAVFLLGTIKSAQIKKLILGEEVVADKVEEKESMKIIVYNAQTSEQYVINYPYKEVKSYCVGSNTAYFVNENNALIHCVLTNVNQGQKQLNASVYPFLQNKRIISIYGGLHYFVALNREENLLQNWNNEHVIEWLRKEGFNDYINIMRVEKVNGNRLMTMDKKYMENVLGIMNVNLQQKILLSIEEHMKVSYDKDKLFGWGKNETGQLGNNMAVFFNKPVNIKLPELNKNENIIDVKCGWYNSILTTSEGRVFITTQQIKKQEKKEKEEEISDQQLKQMEKKERRRKKTDTQEENTTGGKKDRKKKGTIDQKQIEKQKEKHEQESHWLQYKSPSGCFSISTTKDILFIIQLAYKQQQSKKKIRTIKAILDKIEWDPNLKKEEYKIGYTDKYMGILNVTIDEYLKSEIKEHRILYFKRNGQIVWHKEDKIDLI